MRVKTASKVALAILAGLAFRAPVWAQAKEVVTVGPVSGNGTVDVPVFIRDTANTPLGLDQPPHSRIQSYSIKVNYSPTSPTASISRAGITSALSPSFESNPTASGTASLLGTFAENTNLIPFTLNAALPGDQVAHMLVTIPGSVPAGTTITLVLDPALTQLSDEMGSPATVETVANGRLQLVDGPILVTPSSAAIDDFVCYGAKLAKHEPPFSKIRNLPLEDEFESKQFNVQSSERNICVPAQTGEETAVDSETHLLDYGIELSKTDPPQPKHTPQRSLFVVANALGSFHVDTVKAKRLLVPAAKGVGRPVTAPDPQGYEVDHFKCYSVRRTKDAPPDPVLPTVVVHDQFYADVRYQLRKPALLCNAVDKAGEGIKHDENHLLCFEMGSRANLCSDDTSVTCRRETDCPGGSENETSFCPALEKITPVYAADQFGTNVLKAGGSKVLCLRSSLEKPD